MGVFEHFPYSNFHEMNLDWILGLLKKWEDIADNIKEMIDEAVEEGLSELNIEEIITNILINYEFAINVKNPPEGLTPAKGDGTTDDTAAINGCVNYAAGLSNGGIVFFPQGLYLTDTITLPSNVTLMGLSKHNVKLVKKASANSTFIGGNGSNNAIYGITLDGNQASSTVQVNGFIGMPVNLEIRECNINNCGGRGVSWSGTNLTIDSVEFEGSGINCLLLNGNGNVSVKNVLFKSLSEATGDGVIVVNSDNCDIEFSSVATCNQCLVLEGENNYVHCRITGATIPVTDSGSGNSVINVVGDYKIGADNLQVNVSGDTTVNGQDVVINGADVVLNPTNPLTYKAPSDLNQYFKSIQFKNGDSVYNVLVEGTYFNNLVNVANVLSFGAVADGNTDCTTAFQNAIDSSQLVFIPSGHYKFNSTLNITKPIVILGECAYMPGNTDVTPGVNGGVILEFNNCHGLKIAYSGVTIENVMIKGMSLPYAYAGIDIETPTAAEEVVRCCVFRNVYINYFRWGIFSNAFPCFKNVFINVWVNECDVGFSFNETHDETSLTFINCWVSWALDCGYRFRRAQYITLINCACDNSGAGYEIYDSNSVTLIGCACESINTQSKTTPPYCGFWANSSTAVALINCYGSAITNGLISSEIHGEVFFNNTDRCLSIGYFTVDAEPANNYYQQYSTGKNDVFVLSNYKCYINGAAKNPQIFQTTDQTA